MGACHKNGESPCELRDKTGEMRRFLFTPHSTTRKYTPYSPPPSLPLPLSRVRHEAGEALGAIGTPECLTPLMQSADDPVLEVGPLACGVCGGGCKGEAVGGSGIRGVQACWGLKI